jgi:hypothetical protein
MASQGTTAPATSGTASAFVADSIKPYSNFLPKQQSFFYTAGAATGQNFN